MRTAFGPAILASMGSAAHFRYKHVLVLWVAAAWRGFNMTPRCFEIDVAYGVHSLLFDIPLYFLLGPSCMAVCTKVASLYDRCPAAHIRET